MILDDSIITYLKEINYFSTFLRLILAAVCGGMIGMERGRRRRAAGLRTHMLVCMGASLVMITNQYISAEFGMPDPTRLGAQVISGIGFLGVGTIIVDKHHQVKGLTTAAGLWACACMGLSIGIGFYSGAIMACALILLTIVILNKFEHNIISTARTLELYAEFESYQYINEFVGFLSKSNIKTINIEMIQPRKNKDDDASGSLAAAILMLRLPKRIQHAEIIEDFNSIPGILSIEELN